MGEWLTAPLPAWVLIIVGIGVIVWTMTWGMNHRHRHMMVDLHLIREQLNSIIVLLRQAANRDK